MMFVIPLCIAIYDRVTEREDEDADEERKVLDLWPLYVSAFMIMSRCLVIGIRYGVL